MGPSSNRTGVLIKRGNSGTEIHTRGEHHVQISWSYGSISQGTTVSWEKDPDQMLPRHLQRQYGPINPFISGF